MGVTLRPGTRLVIASHNEGKVREIADLLAPYGIDVVSAGSSACLNLRRPAKFRQERGPEGGGCGTRLRASGACRRFRA